MDERTEVEKQKNLSSKRESEKDSHATKQKMFAISPQKEKVKKSHMQQNKKNVCNKPPKRESESDVNIKVWGSNRRRGSSPICQEGSLRG